ncbi:hypothetical protein [Ferruginibacter sp.]|nr:hypothetical protein [Ferruginibacter sp.]
MKKIIEFFCYEDDKPVEIQIEPDAIIFTASPNSNLKFFAVNCQDDFEWFIRIDHASKAVQLLPESKGSFQIEVYQDGQQLDYSYG